MTRIVLFLILCCVQPPCRAGDSPTARAECLAMADHVAPVATIDFVHAYRKRDDELWAVFKLVNYDAEQGLAIPLQRAAGTPEVSDLDAFIEFKDLNDNWVELKGVRLPGTTVRNTTVHKVKIGQRLEFRYRLFEHEVLNYPGTEFRLRLYTDPPTFCLLSFPFKAAPATRATGLRPVPHPKLVATRRLPSESPAQR